MRRKNMTIKKYHREREYVAPSTYGAWTPNRLFNALSQVSMPGPNHPRPYPYFSLPSRLRQAYDVLTYRADALYWQEQKKI